jgi:hypothetical protein
MKSPGRTFRLGRIVVIGAPNLLFCYVVSEKECFDVDGSCYGHLCTSFVMVISILVFICFEEEEEYLLLNVIRLPLLFIFL